MTQLDDLGETGLLEPEVGHPYGSHGILEERGHVMIQLCDLHPGSASQLRL